MDAGARDSREYFAAVAEDWERLSAGFFGPELRQKALELAGVVPGLPPGAGAGLTALDMGAGTGFVTEALLDAGLEVLALDREPAMLARLAGRLGGRGRLTTLAADGGRLPLPSACVDFAFANMYLHHAEDPALAVAEMARILKPGGRLVITDLDSHAHSFLLTEHHDRWPGFARADVSAWLCAAGLEGARVDCAGGNCCADSCDGSDKAAISVFAASGRKPLLALRPDQADPEAAAARALALWGAPRPLLCAEAVFQAVAEGLGVRSPLVPRLATGFCSGLARGCGACGAFSAGVMAMGLARGRDSGADELDLAYEPVREYMEFFLARFGSLNCRELTGCDLGAAEGLAQYRERGLKDGLCGPMLSQAAAEALRILARS